MSPSPSGQGLEQTFECAGFGGKVSMTYRRKEGRIDQGRSQIGAF